MNPRVRKLIGMIGILAFLFAYVVAALAIADRLPENAFVQLAYFVIVGTVWFVPMIPLVVWMNWGRWPIKRS